MDKPCSCDVLIVTSQNIVGNTTETKDEYQTRSSLLPCKSKFRILENINQLSLRYRITFAQVAIIITFFSNYSSKVCLKKIGSSHIFVCSSLCIHAM